MRLVTFRDPRGVRVGALDGQGAVRDFAAADASLPRDMVGLIAGGAAAWGAAPAAAARAPVVEGAALLAPIPWPAKNVFCSAPGC